MYKRTIVVWRNLTFRKDPIEYSGIARAVYKSLLIFKL